MEYTCTCIKIARNNYFELFFNTFFAVGKEIGACISFMHYWKGQHYQMPKGLLVHWQYFSRVDVYLFQDKVKGKEGEG